MKTDHDSLGDTEDPRQRNAEIKSLPQRMRTDAGELTMCENPYIQVFASLADAILVDKGGKVIFANAAAAVLHGAASAEQLIGMDFIDLIHPDDRARILSRRLDFLSGKTLGLTKRKGLRLDGAQFFVECSITNVMWNSTPAIVVIIRDVTDRENAEKALRDSEERYRKLLELSPDAIYVLKGRKIVLLNSAALKMFGATSCDQLIGKSPLDLIHSDYQNAAIQRINDAANEGTNTPLLEQKRLRLDGTEFWAQAVATSIKWEHERGWIVVVRDMTSQKRIEDRLLDAKELAEVANRSKSEFLANMSHELRTPLNAVNGFSEMILREAVGPVGNPKYLEYAKDINEAGAHLLELINDILDLSKIEAKRHELREQNIDVSRIVRSCLTLVRERAERQGVEIEIEVAKEMPDLFADECNLKQIFLNLLTNAIKFTLAGGKITVRAWSNPQDGYAFQFADTGIGIAPEDIPNAMAPFGQVRRALNGVQQGTGLGLPLTKSLVELHGGSFDLQTTVGVGTTVTVRFPAERIVEQLTTGT